MYKEKTSRPLPALLLGGLLALACAPAMSAPAPEKALPTAPDGAPLAEQRPFMVTSPFGARPDPWYWLRDDKREDKDMIAYLEAENAHLAKVMAPHRALEQKVYDEIVGRIKQDDATVPVRRNGWWYYQRYETGKQYPIFARRKGSLEAPEEIILDGNQRQPRGQPRWTLGRDRRGHRRTAPVRHPHPGPRERRMAAHPHHQRRGLARLGGRQRLAALHPQGPADAAR
jgi:oligopeptidase B